MAAHEDALGVLQGDLLGQEVSEEQGERSHDEDTEDERGSKDLHAGEELCEKFAEGRCDEEPDAKPHEEAGAGDTRLCHGKRRHGMFKERECRRCVSVAVALKAFEPPSMRCGERGLNLREVGVCREADDEQDECKKIG